jgi:hypothetical protein
MCSLQSPSCLLTRSRLLCQHPSAFESPQRPVSGIRGFPSRILQWSEPWQGDVGSMSFDWVQRVESAPLTILRPAFRQVLFRPLDVSTRHDRPTVRRRGVARSPRVRDTWPSASMRRARAKDSRGTAMSWSPWWTFTSNVPTLLPSFCRAPRLRSLATERTTMRR